MSRSHRKTPVTAWTCAASEKRDKVAFHKKERHTNKHILVTTLDDTRLKRAKELVDVYSWDKDGKQRFDPKTYPELMRK